MTSAAPERCDSVLDLGWSSPLDIEPTTFAGLGATGIRAVAATDFPVLGIPSEFGGGGCTMEELAAAQRWLGRHDPSIAVALNMHSLTIGLMTEYWSEHRDSSWMLLEGLANTHHLLASAFAEPGGSANFMDSRSTAEPVGRDYVVTGTKFPCSLATTAELLCLNARVLDTDEVVVALVPAKSPGISVRDDWDVVGMTTSDTAAIVLDRVHVDRRMVFHRAPAGVIDDLVIAGVVWFSVLAASTYHGVLTSLIDAAIDASKGRHAGAHAHALVGQATREVWALGAAARCLASDWQRGDAAGSSGLAAAMCLRSTMSRARNRVIEPLTEVAGSAIFSRNHRLAQLALDSAAVHHHPPSLAACDEAVGAHALGLPIHLDPIS